MSGCGSPLKRAVRDKQIVLTVILLVAATGASAAITLRPWLNTKIGNPIDELIVILKFIRLTATRPEMANSSGC